MPQGMNVEGPCSVVSLTQGSLISQEPRFIAIAVATVSGSCLCRASHIIEKIWSPHLLRLKPVGHFPQTRTAPKRFVL